MAEHGIEHLPVTLFASVMGIGGASLAWRRASHAWGLPQWPSRFFLAVAAITFVVLVVTYLGKWVRYPTAARAELYHPIRLAFVPTITIALLVLATAGQDITPAGSRVAWWIGAVGHLAGTVWVLSAWSTRPDIGAPQVTPAWLIPVVGNVVTPLAAPTIGSTEFAWFAFGGGVVFWLGLLPLLLQRVLTTETPIPPRLLPSLAIFVAPPAVILLSWEALTGGIGSPVSRILYAAVLMFVVLVAAQWRRLQKVPFSVAYWAYTFPLSAAATAAIAVSGARPGVAYQVVAIALLTLATGSVIAISGRTLVELGRRTLLLPEG